MNMELQRKIAELEARIQELEEGADDSVDDVANEVMNVTAAAPAPKMIASGGSVGARGSGGALAFVTPEETMVRQAVIPDEEDNLPVTFFGIGEEAPIRAYVERVHDSGQKSRHIMELVFADGKLKEMHGPSEPIGPDVRVGVIQPKNGDASPIMDVDFYDSGYENNATGSGKLIVLLKGGANLYRYKGTRVICHLALVRVTGGNE